MVMRRRVVFYISRPMNVARMAGEDVAPQERRVDVEINLGGGNALMAEHLLDGSQIGAPSSRCDANEWRSVWGDIFLSIPALAAARRMM